MTVWEWNPLSATSQIKVATSAMTLFFSEKYLLSLFHLITCKVTDLKPEEILPKGANGLKFEGAKPDVTPNW